VSDPQTGFVALYRWRVDPAREAAFISAWSRLTELIREHQGGRGSRLHRGNDGLFYGYAQWPSRGAWEAEWHLPAEAEPLEEIMGAAVVERFEPILLTPVGDLLLAG
jgi:heme-degrading monooxygenase HmoA